MSGPARSGCAKPSAHVRGDITLQFLLEAVLLTTVGGVIGILLGIGGSLGLSAAIDQLPAAITWWSPVLAFTVSAVVGIFFGVVPARRAGRLGPGRRPAYGVMGVRSDGRTEQRVRRRRSPCPRLGLWTTVRLPARTGLPSRPCLELP